MRAAVFRTLTRLLLARAAFALGGVANGPPAPEVVEPPPGETRRVVLDSIQATVGPNQAAIQWRTRFELGLLSFDVDCDVGGRWVRVNSAPIPAVNDTAGGSYSVPIFGVDGRWGACRLVARTVHGQSIQLGARSLTIVPGDPAPQMTVARNRARPEVSHGIRSPVFPQGSPAPVDLTSGTSSIKIVTQSQGVHFVSANSLTNILSQPAATIAGWIAAGQIGMSNRGGKVGYIPGNGWTGPGQTGPGLFFYAETNRNNYTYQNVYWIRAGTNHVGYEDGQHPIPAAAAESYQASLYEELDRLLVTSLLSDPEQDFWMWAGMTAGNTNFNSWTTDFSTDHLAPPAAGDSVIQIQWLGGSDLAHRVSVALNGILLGTVDWSGLQPYSARFTAPAGTLVDSSAPGAPQNLLALTAELSPLLPAGVEADQVYLNSFSVSYPRTYYTSVASLEVAASSNSVISVAGFGGSGTPNLLTIDVSDVRQPLVVTNLAVDEPGSVWRASWRPANPGARYAILQSNLKVAAAFPAEPPVLVYPAALADATTRAAYVVVAPSALLESANQLAAYRSRSGLTSRVVPLDDIFNSFSDGLVTPHAVQAFLASAYTNWAVPPRFLILLGAGSIDYRNLDGFGGNLIPPLMIHSAYGLFSSDSLYGDVAGDGVPRVAVGRLPITDTNGFADVFAKIQSYEAERPSPPLRGVLLAGQPDVAGDFIGNITNVAAQLTASYTNTLIHPMPAPAPVNAPVLQAALQASLNGGVDLLNYFGHGAVDRFGDGSSPLLVVNQGLPPTFLPSLNNGGRLPLVVAMTCVAGQYSSPGFNCLTAGLVQSASGGAAAALAPTGLSLDAEAAWINLRLAQLLNMNRTGRFGDVILQSFSLYNQRGPWVTPVWLYNLLGDPALRIKSTAD